MARILVLWVSAIFLAGCGSSDNAADSSADKGAKPAAEREETVFDPMVGTMDRARGVEDLGSTRKDEMDAALEQSE